MARSHENEFRTISTAKLMFHEAAAMAGIELPTDRSPQELQRAMKDTFVHFTQPNYFNKVYAERNNVYTPQEITKFGDALRAIDLITTFFSGAIGWSITTTILATLVANPPLGVAAAIGVGGALLGVGAKNTLVTGINRFTHGKI